MREGRRGGGGVRGKEGGRTQWFKTIGDGHF